MNKADQIISLILLWIVFSFVVMIVVPYPFNVIIAVTLFGPISVLFLALRKEWNVKKNWS